LRDPQQDLGAYRYHREDHQMMRSLVEGALKIPTHCYMDPLNRDKGQCFDEKRVLVTARGSRWTSTNRTFNTVDEQLNDWSADIPYAIPPKYRWGAGQPLEKRRAPLDFLLGPESGVPPVADRWAEFQAANYPDAMRIVDEILAAVKADTFRGTPWDQVSLFTFAKAVGDYTQEELAYYLDTDQAIGDNIFYGPNPVMALLQDLLRAAALKKQPLDGFRAMVVPVKDDAAKTRAGMVTIIHAMLDAAAASGVRIYTGFKADRVSRVAGCSKRMRVEFKNGMAVTTDRLFLNMGKPDLVALGRTSLPLSEATPTFTRLLEATQPYCLTKMYCFWHDAWWLNTLKATVGRTRTNLDLASARWHDGAMRCDDRAALRNCSGSMLVSYSLSDDTYGSSSGLYNSHHDATPYTPLSETDQGRTLVAGRLTPRERLLYDDVHRQLKELYDPALAAAGVRAGVPAPDACVYAAWTHVGVHIRLPYEVVGDVSPHTAFSAPVAGLNLHLTNEAFGVNTGWAESSVTSAEIALHHGVGLGRPAWMDRAFHKSMIVLKNEGM